MLAVCPQADCLTAVAVTALCVTAAFEENQFGQFGLCSQNAVFSFGFVHFLIHREKYFLGSFLFIKLGLCGYPWLWIGGKDLVGIDGLWCILLGTLFYFW